MQTTELKEKLEKATQKIPDFIKILQHDTQEREYEQKREVKVKTEPIQKISGKQFKKTDQKQETKNPDCRYCGTKNWKPDHKCPARIVVCRNCGKKGHFSKVCKSKPIQFVVEESSSDQSDSNESYPEIQFISTIQAINPNKGFYKTKLTLNGKQTEFIIDSGSPITLIPNSIAEQLSKDEPEKLENKYVDVNKNEIEFNGKIKVNVKELKRKLLSRRKIHNHYSV